MSFGIPSKRTTFSKRSINRNCNTPKNNIHLSNKKIPSSKKKLFDHKKINTSIFKTVNYLNLNIENQNTYQNMKTETFTKNIPRQLTDDNPLSDFYKIENFLSTKENEFKKNILRKKLIGTQLNDRLKRNVSLLQENINKSYNEIKMCKSNFDNVKKIYFKNSFDSRINKLKNKNTCDNIIAIRKQNLELIDHIRKIKAQTNNYNSQSYVLNTEINNLKNKLKNLPEMISILEEENKNIRKTQMIFINKIQEMKSKLYWFKYNKEKIAKNFKETYDIYKIYGLVNEK